MSAQPVSPEDLIEAVLRVYYDAYPALVVNPAIALGGPTDQYGLDISTAVSTAQRRGFLTHGATGLPEINAKGMNWLAERSKGTTNAQLENLDRKLIELTAKLAETREAAQVDLEAQIAAQQRSFYTTLIPIFSLFAAVIAIIVTFTQAGSKVVEAGNPQMTWDQTWSVMLPTAITMLGMVLVVWLVIWLSTRRPS